MVFSRSSRKSIQAAVKVPVEDPYSFASDSDQPPKVEHGAQPAAPHRAASRVRKTCRSALRAVVDRREVCHSSGRHLVVEEVESRVALSGAVLSINHRAGGRDLVEAVGTYRVGRSSSLARVLGWGLRGSTSDARPTRAERRTAELNKTDTWLRAAWPQNLWNP